MKAKTALDLWALARMTETLGYFNKTMDTMGRPHQTLQEDSITCRFMIADPIICCEGHIPEECPSCFPARPVIRTTALTSGGNRLQTETHAGDFKLEDFFNSVIEVAGEPLTL